MGAWRLFKTVLCLPTWAITCAAWGTLPDGHPWRSRGRFTPAEWADGATPLTCQASFALWPGVLAVLGLVGVIFGLM